MSRRSALVLCLLTAFLAIGCDSDSQAASQSFKGAGQLLLNNQDMGAQWDGSIQLVTPTEDARAKGTAPTLNMQLSSGLIELALENVQPQGGDALMFGFSTIGGEPLPAPGWCLFNVSAAPPGGVVNCGTPSDGESPPLMLSWSLTDAAQAQALLAAYQAQAASLTAPAQAVAETSQPELRASVNLAAQGAEDSRALFGLLVGAKAPNVPQCIEGGLFEDYDPFPTGWAWCVNMLAQGGDALVSMFLPGLAEEQNLLRERGFSGFYVDVNPNVYDVRIATNVYLMASADGMIQRLEMKTFKTDPNEVLPTLISKFGEPTGQDVTTWTDNQTGQVTGETPNYFWSFSDLFILYESHAADSPQLPMGRVDITSAAYNQALYEVRQQIEQAKTAPLPDRKAM